MYNRSHRLYSSSDEDMARAPKVTAHLKAPTVPSPTNGVARIFVWGGPLFHDLRRPTRFGGGGGVVAEIFRDRHKPARFSGGGGVVAEFFRNHDKGQNFFSGNRRSRSLKLTLFGYIFFTFPPDLEIFRNSLHNFFFTRTLGGAMAPPGPPLATPLSPTTAHPKAPTVPSPTTERTPELHRPVRPRTATPTTSGAATTVSPGAYSGKIISITEVCTV